MRKTSICGLGQVALGPVASVLGLQRGGTAARAQPKDDDPQFDDQTGDDQTGDHQIGPDGT
jgi:formate dehydrogenase/NADH-quinone oxidoreductase subunit F